MKLKATFELDKRTYPDLPNPTQKVSVEVPVPGGGGVVQYSSDPFLMDAMEVLKWARIAAADVLKGVPGS